MPTQPQFRRLLLKVATYCDVTGAALPVDSICYWDGASGRMLHPSVLDKGLHAIKAHGATVCQKTGQDIPQGSVCYFSAEAGAVFHRAAVPDDQRDPFYEAQNA